MEVGPLMLSLACHVFIHIDANMIITYVTGMGIGNHFIIDYRGYLTIIDDVLPVNY